MRAEIICAGSGLHVVDVKYLDIELSGLGMGRMKDKLLSTLVQSHPPSLTYLISSYSLLESSFSFRTLLPRNILADP